MSHLIGLANEMEHQPGVLSVSVIEGFPYADVPELGMSFIAITDHDQDLANNLAKSLAVTAWDLRNDFWGTELTLILHFSER